MSFNMKVFRGFSQNMLKLLAAFSMLVDHIGAELFPDITALRIIGRIAFPVFAYFIWEGSRYTHNKLRYLLQIFLLGILCAIGYYIYSGKIYANVLITFSLSICMLYSMRFFIEKTTCGKIFSYISLILILISVFLCYIIEHCLSVDYTFYGVLVPIFIELSDMIPQNKIPPKYMHLLGFSIGLLLLSIRSGGIRYWCLMSIPLLIFYNETRGKFKMKYFFYWFYPAHLLIIGVISRFIFNN